MKIEHRSYSGRLFRPKPEIHVEEDGSLAIIATPWGARSGAKKCLQIISDFFLSAKTDLESTSPFEKLDCLSPTANNLRSAVLLAHDALFQEDNKNEYVTGCELFACAKINREFTFVQLGQPHVYVSRTGLPLIPANCSFDLTLSASPQGTMLSPLPQNLLGTSKKACLDYRTVRYHEGDKLVLLSRSLVPPRFLSVEGRQASINLLSSSLSEQDEEMPFWLGLIEP